MGSIDKIVELALEEDLGLGDVTTESIFNPDSVANAEIATKEKLVLCGIEVARSVFQKVDPSLKITICEKDGSSLKPGTRVCLIEGHTAGILKAERTALNFLQHLSGMATLSRRYAELAEKYQVRVVDTRKTIPGFRALAKYAVRCGGCHNHRSSLADLILIKNNHLAASGSIREAILQVKKSASHTAKIEIEVSSPQMALQAIEAGAEVILLDNMDPGEVSETKRLTEGRAVLEVSGGINLDNVESYMRAGTDVISVGELTHSSAAVDLHLRIIDRSARFESRP